MSRLVNVVATATAFLLVTTATAANAQVAATTVASADSKKAPVPTTAAPGEVTIHREVFSYEGGGRRDPYISLMTSSDIRPLLSDLRLTAIAFDPDGRNSVAILRDMFSKTQYRARVGQQLGRMRVSSISAKTVQFTIEEYGFNRTETMRVMSDSTTARNQ